MKLIAPDYYPQFRCIADRCRHSCCIGWEIDVDPDRREEYRRVPGEFGARLNASIDDSGETACFRLGPDERCPMLNASGLCDLITELGEGALCQICADHPRFRSFFADRTEIGLGLCCEEAAQIILTREKPMKLITLEDDGESTPLNDLDQNVLDCRDWAMTIIADRNMPISERLNELFLHGGLDIRQRDWVSIYRKLEHLDPMWDTLLAGIKDDLSIPEGTGVLFKSDHRTHKSQTPLDICFELFCEYLLYRHLPGALEDDDTAGRVAFCVLSTRILMALCAGRPGCTLADCIEFARMYSAEIEYDEDNIAALLDALWEEE